MEFLRLGVESELQLLAYDTATATRNPNCIHNLHHSLPQGQILNPLSRARDQTRVLMDTSRVCFRSATTGNSKLSILILGHYGNTNTAQTLDWRVEEGKTMVFLYPS